MKSLLFALSALVFATSAPAGAWEQLSDAEVCRIGESWELGNFLFISKPKAPEGDNILGDLMGDHVLIAMRNDDWASLKGGPEDEIFADFTIRFEDEYGSWLENKPIIGNKMFILITTLEHLENFKHSTSMVVTRDGKKVAHLDWSGFFLPFIQFQQCIEKARAPIIEEQRKERLRRDTPVDPFAG